MNNKLPIENPPPVLVFIVRLIFLCISKIYWRIKFINVENIPQNSQGGLLVVSNHQTYFDPFWISLPIKRDLRFMAWDKAFDWFFVGFLIKQLGAFPVNTKFGSRKSIRQSVKLLSEGKTLMVFPEAGREFADGEFLPFKPGAAQLALQTGVPILPVTVRGANRVWAREMKFPRPAKVEIVFHPIITVEEFGKEMAPAELTGIFKEIIESGKHLQKKFYSGRK